MGLFDVMLGVDRAARDTGRRIHMRMVAMDRLSAAIEAEEVADFGLRDPLEYTHAVSVTPVRTVASVGALLAAA
jgi:hypothetical protein